MTMDGLFAALAGWRTTSTHLERLPRGPGSAEAGAVLQLFPKHYDQPLLGEPTRWVEHPTSLRRGLRRAVRH
jgi:hypothetical protein